MKNIFFTAIAILIILNMKVYSQRDLESLSSDSDLKQYILANTPREDALVALQMLAKKYIDSRNWEKAISVFKNYQNNFPAQRNEIQKIIELLNSTSPEITPVNLGSRVNTSADEYFPVITVDSRTIYFTGANRKDGYGGEDIFKSEISNGIWQLAKNAGIPFSTKDDDAVNSISADGNTIILFGNYRGAIGGGDNFYSELTLNGWTEVKPFPKPINSAYWDCDGFLSADGKAFFFTSDRRGNTGDFHKGGIFYHGLYEGNTDIYVCTKPDSGWSAPINLGNVINTPYTERSPFLHPDGRTLYFSSDGHYGLGSLDVFRTYRLNDTSWTEWSEPVNLGKEINTSGFDIAYKVSTDGKYAYFASNRIGGEGGFDIYYTALPEETKPQKNVVTVSGTATDENDRPLEAEIKWLDISNNNNIGILRTNPVNGSYIIALPVGSKYNYFAEKKGFYSSSNEIDLSNENEYKELTVNIKLSSITSLQQTGEVIRISNIYFDFDKAELKAESFTELDRLYQFLYSNPEITAEISAHTDSQGTDEYNFTLSLRRAESVVNYLKSKGIEEKRLIAKGYGETRPVDTNETEEGRANNRRVEMRIVK